MNAMPNDLIDPAAWLTPPPSCPRFAVATTPDLRRRGIRGSRVVVVLVNDTIGFMGVEGGDFAMPLARLAGLRAGRVRVQRHDDMKFRLFFRNPEETLVLNPLPDPADALAQRRAYPDLVRAVAGRLAAQGRLDAIETGIGWGWAVVSTALLSLPAIGMVAVFAWVVVSPLPPEEHGIALAFTGLAMAGMIALALYWWRATWPRRIRRLPDLEHVLPRP